MYHAHVLRDINGSKKSYSGQPQTHSMEILELKLAIVCF